MYRYISGESDMKVPALIAIADAAGVSVGWLAKGEVSPAPLLVARDSATPDPFSEFVLVPRYDVRAAGGGGAIVQSEQVVDHLCFKRQWLQQEGIAPARCALIEATGDSMEPTISAGDLVLVALDQVNPATEGVYVLRRRSALLIKRLHLLHTGQLQIRSDNPVYDTEIVEPNDVQHLQLIGRVRWVGRRFTGRWTA